MVDVVRGIADDGVRARRDRAAVSLERAVARARACAVRRRHSVPRVRRHALFRARGGQARARVPAPHRGAGRRRRVPARRELPAARHRRAHARAAAGERARAGHEPVAGRGIRQGRRQGGRGARGIRKAHRSSCATTRRALPLPEAVEHVIEKSGLMAHYRAEKDGQDRVENLAELDHRSRQLRARGGARHRRADALRARRSRCGRTRERRGRRRDRSFDRVPRARGARGRRHAGSGRAGPRCSS